MTYSPWMNELALMEESMFPGQEAPELPAEAGLVAESPYLAVDYTGWEEEQEELAVDMSPAEMAYAGAGGFSQLAQAEDVFPPTASAAPVHVEPRQPPPPVPGVGWLERSIAAGFNQAAYRIAGEWLTAGTILTNVFGESIGREL